MINRLYVTSICLDVAHFCSSDVNYQITKSMSMNYVFTVVPMYRVG